MAHQRIRALVTAGSIFGLCIAVALALAVVAGDGESGLSRGLVALILCAPFVVALVATRLDGIVHQRIGWAIAAALAAITGVSLFTGVGIFYLALAAGFTWAIVASSRTREHPTRL